MSSGSTRPTQLARNDRSAFRFTLRESMLAMVAAAALLALAVKSYKSSRPFTPSAVSGVLTRAAVSQLVGDAAKRLNLAIESSGSASEGSSSSGDALDRDMSIEVRGSTQDAPKVVAALKQEIEQVINKQQCEIRSVSRSGTETDMERFSFGYELGETRGHLLLYYVPSGNEAWQLNLLIHEYQAVVR